MCYLEQIDKNHIPQHVAIIMDGNGRWAKKQGKERTYGHREGTKTAQKIVEDAALLGIKYLTLYTFSTENWKRPQQEIAALMDLLVQAIEDDNMLQKNNIRLKIIGDLNKLPGNVRLGLLKCIEHSAEHTGMNLVLALSYSSRWEITRTVKALVQEAQNGELTASDITEDFFSSRLLTGFMPDPDLIIRTGGEVRLSNYLLWQGAYSELYFCDTFWPDFDVKQFRKAICEYQQRERRFGQTSEQIN